MDQLSRITFWLLVLLTVIGGGFYAASGGVNVSTFVFLFKKGYAKLFLIYILCLILFQFGLFLIIELIIPEATFKSNLSLLINSFFNGGWHEFDVASNGSLIFISVIMLCGRVITLFAPWYIFMIKSGKLPDEIRS